MEGKRGESFRGDEFKKKDNYEEPLFQKGKVWEMCIKLHEVVG